jgi:hypothetical protein
MNQSFKKKKKKKIYIYIKAVFLPAM